MRSGGLTGLSADSYMVAGMTASGSGPPGREVSVPARGDRTAIVAMTLGVMAVAALAAGLFLPHQALWIDETTQLSGLSLSPPALVQWLAHPAAHDFGVPADRMPPLSYWLGWLWSRLFGLNEHSLRVFGLICVAGAAALVASAARRAFGLAAGLCAGLFLALSPNVCVTAVEIRAYPLFLLTTAGCLRALVLLLEPPSPTASRRSWIVLGAWLIAGMYTHFLGALLAGVVVLALAVDRLIKRSSLRPVIALATVVAIGVAGLVPFVIASIGLSAPTARDRVHEVVQLVYRLIGHPAMSVFPWAIVLAFGAAAVLVCAAWSLPRQPRRLFQLVALMLVSGIAISAAANFVVAGFTAAKVSYSTWALPLIAFVLSAPLALPKGRWSPAVLAAAVVFAACEGTGIGELAWHGEYFAHGPQNHLQQILDKLQRQHPAVVYADPVDDYAAAYFPLRFANGPALAQFVFADAGDRPPLGIPIGLPAETWRERLRGYSHLVVVRSRAQNARQLVDQIRHGDHPFDESRLITALESSRQWRPQEHELFVSFVAADVTVLARTGPD